MKICTEQDLQAHLTLIEKAPRGPKSNPAQIQTKAHVDTDYIAV
jgi:hypothetical protein